MKKESALCGGCPHGVRETYHCPGRRQPRPGKKRLVLRGSCKSFISNDLSQPWPGPDHPLSADFLILRGIPSRGEDAGRGAGWTPIGWDAPRPPGSSIPAPRRHRGRGMRRAPGTGWDGQEGPAMGFGRSALPRKEGRLPAAGVTSGNRIRVSGAGRAPVRADGAAGADPCACRSAAPGAWPSSAGPAGPDRCAAGAWRGAP